LRRNPVRKTWRSAIAISNAISRSCRHMNHCSLSALFDSCIRQTSPLRRNVHIDAIISPAPTSIRQTESTKIQRKFTHDQIYYKSERNSRRHFLFSIDRFRWDPVLFSSIGQLWWSTSYIQHLTILIISFKRSSVANARRRQTGRRRLKWLVSE
jgi:hypothetical protein